MAIEEDIAISLPGGETDAVVFFPTEDEEYWRGILYITDIGGIRTAQRQAANRLATNPELFGARIRELTQPLTPDALERDAKAYVDYLTTLAPGKLGVVGFCFCGGVAMRVAAACPDQVAACASFHGGNLYENKPTSPHLLLPRIKARLLFGHAEQDKSMPAEAIASFEEALKNWGGHFESETYEGALPGWTTLDNPAYNPPQAARAYLAALFRAL